MRECLEKKELAIVFGATGNMTFALGNVLIGLKKHSPHLNADIIVFEQNISVKDKNILNSILSCRFIYYKFPYDGFLTKDTLKRFSELTFARFECFKLLNKYKKVLWLDIDILICQDIQPLLDFHSTGISLALGDENAPDFDIEVNDISHYNAGVLYLQDNLFNYQALTEWCYNKTLEYSQCLKCADQGIINLMIKELGIIVHSIPQEFNFNPIYTINADTRQGIILHTFCPEKFWNYWINNEWDTNYQEWTKIGGSKYKGFWKRKLKDIPNPIRKPRRFIKYLINKIRYFKAKG